jgi:hypothetical protein
MTFPEALKELEWYRKNGTGGRYWNFGNMKRVTIFKTTIIPSEERLFKKICKNKDAGYDWMNINDLTYLKLIEHLDCELAFITDQGKAGKGIKFLTAKGLGDVHKPEK